MPRNDYFPRIERIETRNRPLLTNETGWKRGGNRRRKKKESAVVERVKSLETRAPLYARTPDRILRLSRSPLFPLHVAHSARCNPDFQRPRFTFRICCRATFHGNCLERGGASGKQRRDHRSRWSSSFIYLLGLMISKIHSLSGYIYWNFIARNFILKKILL